jgi:hypothetical protein
MDKHGPFLSFNSRILVDMPSLIVEFWHRHNEIKRYVNFSSIILADYCSYMQETKITIS